MITKSKIRGLFFGGAIGDALGMSVESFSKSKIASKYGRLVEYKAPVDHKWFNGKEAGTTTDDTALQVATAESIIESNGFDMDSQAKWHIKALQKSDEGMGDTTRFSIKNLIEGVHWSKSGLCGDNKGLGNGVAMKISPIAAYFAIKADQNKISELEGMLKFIVDYNNMTHKTKLSLTATLAIFALMTDCLLSSKKNVDINHLYNIVMTYCLISDSYKIAPLYPEKDKDDLLPRIEELFRNVNNYSYDDLIEKYGEGRCYAYDSIPFSIGFFLKNPNSIDALFDVINSGGDTDTNGAIVGSLLGCLNGEEIFPKYLIDGLKERDYISDLSERFCNKFNIKV